MMGHTSAALFEGLELVALTDNRREEFQLTVVDLEINCFREALKTVFGCKF